MANNSGQLVPLADHRNSIVATFSTALQNIDQIAEYDPHGRVTLRNSDEVVVCEEAGNAGIVCDAPSGLPFGFASALRSDVTGLVYMRNRWYSPRLGQFISHDPLGYIDAHNLYAYVAFDPINFLDPWGLEKNKNLARPLTEEEKQFLKFATSRDPNRKVDPEDLVKGAAKQVANDAVDNLRTGVCIFALRRCAIDTYQNGISPPVFKPDNPDQETAGNIVVTISMVAPNPGKVVKALKNLGRAAGWFGRMLKAKRKWKKLVPKFKIDKKQFGKKIGKHTQDFGLDVSSAKDRAKMKGIIDDIGNNPDKVVRGDFVGQGLGGARGPVDFRIKGSDVVVTKSDGTFVTILQNGIENPSVKNAMRKK